MFGDRARWLTITLAVSVLLNLFLAGIVLGRMTMPWTVQAGIAATGPLLPRDRVRALPISERRAFAEVMRRHTVDIRAARRAVREAKHAAQLAMATPQYDRKTLEARLADLRRATLAQQTLLHAAVAEALGTLSAQSRATITNNASASVGKSL